MLLRNYACPLYNDFTCLNSLTRFLMFGKVNTGAGFFARAATVLHRWIPAEPRAGYRVVFLMIFIDKNIYL